MLSSEPSRKDNVKHCKQLTNQGHKSLKSFKGLPFLIPIALVSDLKNEESDL